MVQKLGSINGSSVYFNLGNNEALMLMEMDYRDAARDSRSVG